MELSEVLELLSGATDKQKQDLEALIAPSLKERVWVPNPGPQTTAFYSEADEVFYGGQAGGGKTDLEIGLALTEHRRSLILRRTNNEVKGLIDRMRDIVGNSDGLNSQTGTWRREDGRVIETGGCQLEVDKQKYKGNPHDLICVGKGTPVLMSNGTYKQVEQVEVGDMVMTLSGPRRVNRSFRVVDKPLTRLNIQHADGSVTTQVQSSSHKILTQTGWVSRDTLGDVSLSPLLAADSTEYRYLGKSASKSCHTHGLTSQVQCNPSWLARNTSLFRVNVRSVLCVLSQWVKTFCKGRPDAGTGSSKSDGAPLVFLRQTLCRLRSLVQTIRYFRSNVRVFFGSLKSRGVSCVQSSSSLLGYLVNYLRGFRPRDEHTLPLYPRVPGRDLPSPPLSTDAAQRNPIYSQEDAAGNIHVCNRQSQSYPHPYTMGIYSSVLPLKPVSYSYTPVKEKVDLYDLEIEEVNHFITEGGIVNKNCFDEVSDFTETQYTFIIAWNRSAVPGQRCRVVAAGNPPTRPEGLWVVKRWAAWLDPQHPNPAEPGQLRWYTTGDDGEELEVDGPGPHMVGGRPVYARSRTFIPATLQDNPDLIASGYQASLDALPPELRAAYRDGDFQTTLKDDAYQIIPTSWVVEAQNRWKPNPPVGVPMCAMGVDVAIAKDKFVVACRHDGYYPKPLVIPGHEVSDPKKAAGRVVAMRRDAAKVIVDVGGGWGADCYAQLAANNIDCIGYMGVKGTKTKSADGRFTFANVRTHALWSFREALDPSQPGGSIITLPPSATLRADLCAPSYQVKGNARGATLQAESKQDVCDRLGRSTDEGDAVVMAWYDGVKQTNLKGGWQGGRGDPVVNRGTRSSYIRRGRANA